MGYWGDKVVGKYEVKEGDNLTSISKELDVPIDSLTTYNNIISPDKIFAGQKLLWRREPTFVDNLRRFFFEPIEKSEENRATNDIIQQNIFGKSVVNEKPIQESVQKAAASLSFEDFMEDLRITENPNKQGYKDGRWWPFRTANGNIDIGYGIDLSKQTKEFRDRVTKYGLSDEELREELLKRFNTYQDNMKRLFAENDIDITKVPINYQRGVIDMLHHLGYNGMSKYKNFFAGIRNNDLEAIRREARTTFRNKAGKRQLDKRRYDFRLNNYFTSMRRGGKIKYQDGGMLDYGSQDSLANIKIDPSIFVSWNSIQTSDLKLPDDYLIDKLNDSTLEETDVIKDEPSVVNEEVDEEVEEIDETDVVKEEEPDKDITKVVKEEADEQPSAGKEEFDKAFDEVIKKNPEAAKYRKFLTEVAKHESGFNPTIKNPNAPAYGYFQFMQDGDRYNNITAYANSDINTFLGNPKLQIEAAIKLAEAFERSFSSKDREKAQQSGISEWGLIGGAWLGGPSGVKKLLYSNVNVDDKHWGGAGIDMVSQIKRYNTLAKGGVLERIKYVKNLLADYEQKNVS